MGISDLQTKSLYLASPMTSLAYQITCALLDTTAKKAINAEEENKAFIKVFKEQVALAQELAITQRIEMADEVEIEEYYDTSAKGKVGISGDDKGISIGVHVILLQYITSTDCYGQKT